MTSSNTLWLVDLKPAGRPARARGGSTTSCVFSLTNKISKFGCNEKKSFEYEEYP